MDALIIIPILAVLILVHELGHFVSAKMAGIRVLEFGLGLPPRLFGREKGGVIYSLNAIPLGGFVRVHGEDGSSDDEDSLHAQGKLKRTIFYGAGSFMNFVLAIVLVILLVGVQGEAVNHVYVAEVVPDTPAEDAGWQAGDRFVEVAGTEVEEITDVVTETNAHAGGEMPVTIYRDGEEISTTVAPRQDPPAEQGRTGIRITSSPRADLTVSEVMAGESAAEELQADDRVVSIAGREVTDGAIFAIMLTEHAGESVDMTVERAGEMVDVTVDVPEATEEEQPAASPQIGVSIQQDIQTQSIPFWRVIPAGFTETWNILTAFYEGINQLISGQAPLDGVAGPIGMGQLASEVLEVSPEPAWVALANLTVLLSLNLGILNLLPLPALDGGRLFFVLIEAIRGQPISPQKEGLVHLLGLVMLLGLMFFIAFLDIERLISGESILP